MSDCRICRERKRSLAFWVKAVLVAPWRRVTRRRGKGVRAFAAPWFYCQTCKRFIPNRRVVLGPASVDSEDSASFENAIGFDFTVSCHSETERRRVTLVALMVGRCHLDAFSRGRA